MVLKVVQWTTGGVARQAVRAVLADPLLELVGAFAYSADKVGRDVGELCGLEPVGTAATDDVEALLSLRPDCVIYTPLYFDAAEVARILEQGINVVTTSEFLTGRGAGEAALAQVHSAAERGGASIFGSGMNPGFAQLLGAVIAGICTNIRHVRVIESFDTTMFAGDGNMDELGWGRPKDSPGHEAALAEATVVFADGLDVMAELLGVTLDERRCTADFAYATDDLALPGRPIAAGTVAGIDLRWEGLVDGRPVVESHQRWVMGSRMEPRWNVESGYVVEIDGEPKVRTKVDIWPHQDDLSTLTPDDFHAIGMVITGLPVVNAIPAVCAAAPGIRTYAELPVITGRLA
ncbi:dihydrodipicolinate reductase [soil metagenome]